MARENYNVYNRMGLGKVVYGRTGMEGLNLMKEEWYERNRIDTWLNTQVIAIDRDAKQIRLGTGEMLPYDTVILATGARASMPPIEGFDLPGRFVLREAADAGRALAAQHADREFDTGQIQALKAGDWSVLRS